MISTRTPRNLNRSFVLHSYAYQESSLIANIFTFEEGRVNILAKGVKSSKKGISSLLQPFQQLSLSYLQKNELSLLLGTEKYFPATPHLSGKALYCAYYLNELLLRLLPLQEPCTEIYLLYEESLMELSSSENIEQVLRSFEVQLLFHLGYELNLEFDVISNQAIKTNSRYYYDPLSGPFEKGENHSGNENQTDRAYPQVTGKCLIALNGLDFSDKSVVKECKNLLRLVLQQYLGNKPLKSRELYKQLYGIRE